jgi:hypothetical protein
MFEALELFISFHPFTRGFIWVVACSFPANIANNRVVTAPPPPWESGLYKELILPGCLTSIE